MMRLAPFALVASVGLLGSACLRADPFAIDLEAQAAKVSKTAHAEPVPPDGKAKPRAVLTVKVNTPITVKWALSNTGPTLVLKDIVVHFFAVQEEKADQQKVPRLDRNVVAESAVSMGFKPRDRAEGEITFAIARPGYYLLRVETRGTAGKDGHEQFAALDVVVR
jgi:hypothetical protein